MRMMKLSRDNDDIKKGAGAGNETETKGRKCSKRTVRKCQFMYSDHSWLALSLPFEIMEIATRNSDPSLENALALGQSSINDQPHLDVHLRWPSTNRWFDLASANRHSALPRFLFWTKWGAKFAFPNSPNDSLLFYSTSFRTVNFSLQWTLQHTTFRQLICCLTR